MINQRLEFLKTILPEGFEFEESHNNITCMSTNHTWATEGIENTVSAYQIRSALTEKYKGKCMLKTDERVDYPKFTVTFCSTLNPYQ